MGNVCENNCGYRLEAGNFAAKSDLKTLATGSMSNGTWYVDQNLTNTGIPMPAGVDALHIVFGASLERWVLISDALAGPAPYTLSLTATPAWIKPGDLALVTATANQDVRYGGQAIKIFDLVSGSVVANCPAGATCAFVTTASNDLRLYQAVTGAASGPLNPGAVSQVLSVPTGFDVPANVGIVPNSADVGDPVNVATGNLHDTVADLGFPSSAGLPALTRTYNSMDPKVGVLGAGWSSSFQSTISTDVVGNALLRTDDGKTLRFVLRPAGGFVSPSGFDGDLTHQVDGSWQVAARLGGVIDYDSSGEVTGMTNADGTTVTITRSSGRVSSVSSSTGVSLSFTYDATSGWLAAVSSSDGRSVAFGYSSGQLSTATAADGGITHYGYDVSGRLISVVDGDGRTVVVTSYDTTGRVIRQQTAQGQLLDFAYSDDASRSTTVAESSGASTSYAFDAQARMVSVTDTLAHTATRGYDSNGHLNALSSRLSISVGITTDAAGNVTSRAVPGGTEQYGYDSSNRLISTTDVLNHTTSYAYGGANRTPSVITWPDQTQTTQTVVNGLVTVRTDADGVTTTFGYDGARNLTSIQVGTAPATTMTYDAAGRMLTRTSPGGHVSAWTYDEAGRVLTATDPASAVTSYAYDFAGHLTSSTDPNLHTTSYVYDGAGQLIETHHADGTVTLDSYDDRGQLLTETRPGGAVTTYSYGPLGRLTSATDPMGRVTSYGHDDDGQVTTTSTADGTSSNVYDPAGQLLSSTDPAGHITSYTRDALERVTAVTDPTGAITRTSYNSMGRVATTTDALGHVTTNGYTPAGRLASITYPDGHERSYDYDSLGQRIGDTDPGGGLTATAYTADGQVDTVTSPGGLITDYGYDPAGRISTLSSPGAGTVTTTFTPTGQVATRTDATGGVVQFSYDVMDRLVSATDPLGKITSYGYDGRGNRTSVTDARGHVWTSTFNLDDEPTGTTDPLGHASILSYDPLGRLLSSTDASGVSATNTYDTAGNLTRVTFGDSSHTDYGYDAAGRRLSATTAAGTETFTYDSAGQLLTDTLGTGVGARAVGYGYDVLGRVGAITYPDASTTTRSYDPNGNLLTAGHTGGGQASYTFDPDGHVLTATAGSGNGQRTRSFTWTAGLLTGFTETAGAASSTSTLGHDPAGRLTSLSTGAGSTSYGYDPAGQLLNVTSPTGAESYGYDPVGNLSSATVGGVSTSYSYDNADQLTASTGTAGASSYGYDAAGRLLSTTGPTGSSSNSYDAQGRLAAAGTTAAGTSTSRVRGYTPAGELGSVTTTTSTQLLPGLPATVSSSTTGLSWDRTHTIPQPLVLTTGGADSNLTLGPGNDLAFASTPSAAAAVFSHNALGDLLPTADTAGLVQGSSSYTAYGQPGGTSSSIGFGYRSQLHLGSQLYLHHRTFDPSLGRFTSRDPLDGTPGQTVATNPYHYAGNDPINHADPSGLDPNITDSAITAGFGGAAPAVCLRPTHEQVIKGCLTAELAAQGAAAVAVGAAAGCAADILIYGSVCGSNPGNGNSASAQTGTALEPRPRPTGGVPTKPKTTDECQEGKIDSFAKLAPYAAFGICERHHIIQQAAVRGFVTVANGFLGNYSKDKAPAILLSRPNHRLATNAQDRAPWCGTYGDEKDVAVFALEAAGQAANADEALRWADRYFNPLGVHDMKDLARSGTRRSCKAA